ncbi:MAG: class I tRNA ligase family protein, partial [Longicatena sp.]
AKGFIKMFACFAPHIGEELWANVFHNKESISYAPWPVYDEAMLVEDVLDVIVQVNGKLRGKFSVEAGTSEDNLKEEAMKIASVAAQLEGKTIRKVIVVKGKVVNIVAN